VKACVGYCLNICEFLNLSLGLYVFENQFLMNTTQHCCECVISNICEFLKLDTLSILLLFVENGFVGYSTDILANNTNADYAPGESFFTVFGVFFSTATGLFSGINMSGDLRSPSHSIPIGTLSAVGVRYGCVVSGIY